MRVALNTVAGAPAQSSGATPKDCCLEHVLRAADGEGALTCRCGAALYDLDLSDVERVEALGGLVERNVGSRSLEVVAVGLHERYRADQGSTVYADEAPVDGVDGFDPILRQLTLPAELELAKAARRAEVLAPWARSQGFAPVSVYRFAESRPGDVLATVGPGVVVQLRG